MLTSMLQPHSLRSWDGLAAPAPWSLRVDLGSVGRCPDQPDLTIVSGDGSGSVAAPGGADPIGNRYQEASIAFGMLRRCRCGGCMASIAHFDTPAGDVAPGKLADREFQKEFKAGLRDPPDGMGVSLIGPSLAKAEQIARDHPQHRTRLVVLTDWALFDSFDYVERLKAFPGRVLAVGLGRMPPPELNSESVAMLQVTHGDAPGTVARALFKELVRDRPGAAKS